LLVSERHGQCRIFQLVAADLGECHLRVQDELTGDPVCDVKRSGVDTAKQSIIHEFHERRHARDLGFCMRKERDTDAAPVGAALPLGQKAGFLQAADFGRDVGRRQRHMLRQFPDGDAVRPLGMGHSHQNRKLARGQVKFAAERIAARQQAADALDQRVDGAAEARV
jgi:hypothetical protein